MSEQTGEAETEGPPPVAYRRGRSPFRAAPKDPLLERAPGQRAISALPHGTARRDLLAGAHGRGARAAVGDGLRRGGRPLAGQRPLRAAAAGGAYALLGSSRQLIVGPEGSISALVGAAVLPLAAAGSAEAAELAAMLALLVAACFLLAWSLRLGWLADYFSRPVLDRLHPRRRHRPGHRPARKLLGVDIAATDPLRQLVEASASSASASGDDRARRRRRARGAARRSRFVRRACRPR